MSKSLVILSCNFVLLSVLTLLHWKLPGPSTRLRAGPAAGMVDRLSDRPTDAARPAVLDLLKKSLEHERSLRGKLDEELTQTKSRLGQTDFQLAQAQETLRAREVLLAEREEQIRQGEDKLRRRDQEAKALELERNGLEQQLAMQRTNWTALQQRYQIAQTALTDLERQHAFTRETLQELQQKYAGDQTNLARMQAQIAATSFEANIAEQVIAALQEDLRNQVALSAQLQQQLLDSGKSGAKPSPAAKPAVTRLARASENAKVLAGAENLLGAGAIAFEFNSNQVEITLQARRAGIFGQTVVKDSSRKTILIERDGRVYAVFHFKDMPVAPERSPPELQSFTSAIRRGTNVFTLTELSILDRDPRIVLVPIGRTPAEKLGVKIYPVAPAPLEFPTAILLGANGGYFAESSFQADPATPHYVRMDRTKFSRPSGKVQPDRGDLVLNNSGDVLGIMANKEYCLVLDDLSAARAFHTGSPLEQQPAPLLTEIHRLLLALPPQLQ